MKKSNEASCYNRVSQQGIKVQLEIIKTESRGWDQVYDSSGNIKKKSCFCGSSESTGRLYRRRGDGVPHWFIVCWAVYLRFWGGEKGRKSGNNGGRSETREVSFKMNFTPAKQ
ncbi:hypothetical protein CUMW_215710 [Citrus unshiu]|uniref:Uncharacterized protein n=1 Tax=Citrus unshiu TaxID=55188 RepID=A0A2H5QC17_CITUN|nr:hypothetical protein CUMW_215710 [Citrus unshiu]